MLTELHVRDLALIEDAWLEFGPGLTALTGETGAGKTALLGALGLLLGARGDAQSVRAGANEAIIEGGFTARGDDLVVRRRIGTDGRSRCLIAGSLATVGELTQTVAPLVEVHGQHEHQALLNAATHVTFLDRWGGENTGSALAAYRAALSEYRAARDGEQTVIAQAEDAVRNRAFHEFMLGEIDRIDPLPGEDDALSAQLPALENAERLSSAADTAAQRVRGESGAAEAVGRAREALGRVVGIDSRLDEISESLGTIEVLLDDAGIALRGYRDAVTHDRDQIDAIQERLSALAGLCKKYGPTLDEVVRRRDEARVALEIGDGFDLQIAEARQRTSSARVALEVAADGLAQARASVVGSFTDALGDATRDLAMAGARFEVALHPLAFEAWNESGPERVEFLYAPAPATPARPLAKIASGGEISRVMLALKGVLGTADSVETLVFDEVDAGIGGAVAHSIGRRLAALAQTHQVVVVTHLAQVAAYADHHVVAAKEVSEEGAHTEFCEVQGDARVGEIARMLSGDGSDASRTHAEELLTAARVGR